MKYETYFYVFFCALVCSFTESYSLFRTYKYNLVNQKSQFSSRIILDNDDLAEFFLYSQTENIRTNSLVEVCLGGKYEKVNLLANKIRNIYLDKYLDKYEVQIAFFYSDGKPLGSADNQPALLNKLKNKLNQKRFKTKYKDIYFLKEGNNKTLKRYIQLIKVFKKQAFLGTILLDLKLRDKQNSHSAYLNLLLDDKYKSNFNELNFDFAVYKKNQLYYSTGDFRYESKFDTSFLKITDEQKEHNFAGFDHLIVKQSDNKTLVITSTSLSLSILFSIFCFLFLFLMFSASITLLGSAVFFYYKKVGLNFSTKIQIYVSISLFLPLIAVTLSVMGWIGSAYEEDLKASYYEKINLVEENMVQNLRDSLNIKKNIVQNLNSLSRTLKEDIDFFDAKGKLVYSSQPFIYEAGLVSSYIDSRVYQNIIEEKEENFVNAERIGTFDYYSIYHTIRLDAHPEILGVVKIPFFKSSKQLSDKYIQAANTIINIFTIVFIVFLIISYFTNRWLLAPLKLITEQIKRTVYAENNQTINWKSNDELGLLIKEYNRMVSKLAKSREALKFSEKEAAWGEMARQVAHEIKNPLTPIKLNLQMMLRKISKNQIATEVSYIKPLENILAQIETLNEIASSFSTFAQMPDPNLKPVELIESIKKTLELFEEKESGSLVFQSELESGIVMIDEKLFSRIILNLVLNAFQSVKEDKKAEVLVSIALESKYKIVIKIKDNGEGIPNEVKDKVFIPNFSTKYAGSGLGLAIAKKGIEYTNGKIWFESNASGTTFFITLPIFTIGEA